MKILLKIFILITLFQNLYCQNLAKEFFNDVLIDFEPNISKSILYTDKITNDDINQIDFSLQNDNIEIISKIFKDTLHFSEEEVDYLIKFFKSSNAKGINKSVIPRSKKLSSKKLTNIFDNQNIDNSWEYFYKKFGSEYHTFTFPIFIRNNEVCFIFHGNICGSRCGSSSLLIYRKTNGLWRFYASYWGSIS